MERIVLMRSQRVFCAYGGCGAVASGKKVTTSMNTFIVGDVVVKRRNIKRDKYGVTSVQVRQGSV